MLTMNKDKKPRRVRGRDKGDVVPFGVELSPEHAAALDECSQRERRTKKAIVLLALEAYFVKAGLWPPAGA
jgi:predicted transcriptional regulator